MADVYRAVMTALADLGLAVTINTKPNEIPDPIPFEQDDTHAAYDAEAAQRFWRVLLQSDGPLGRSLTIAFFANFDRTLAARLARCIFSGAALIWQ